MEIVNYLLSFESKLIIYLLSLFSLLLLLYKYINYRNDQAHHPINAYQGVSKFSLFYRKWWRVIFGFSVSGYIGVLVTISWGLYTHLTHTAQVGKYSPDQFINGPQEKVVIEFDVPVDTKLIKINSYPDIGYKIDTTKTFFGNKYSRIITLIPQNKYLPGSRIMLYVSNVKNPLSKGFGSEFLFEYNVSSFPKIKVDSTNINTYLNQKETIELALDYSDKWNNKYFVNSEPQYDFNVELNEKKDKLFITPSNILSGGINYKIFLYRKSDETTTGLSTIEKIYEYNFTTNKPLIVNNVSPLGNSIPRDKKVEIIFDEPVGLKNLSEYITLKPSFIAPKIIRSDDNKNILLDVGLLNFDTEYELTIKKGLITDLGGILPEDLTYTFHTLGDVKVVNVTPNGANNFDINEKISIEFDQAVEKKDIENKFYITPSVQGKFGWKDYEMVFIPDVNLAYDTTYTFGVYSGIKGINGGVLKEKLSYSFKTRGEEFVLDVPYFRQEESFTCNIAAARMLLHYKGVEVSEKELKNDAGYSGARGDGDPNLGYVSNYGTYWDAVKKAVEKYKPARILKDVTVAQILEEVSKGRPVMIWGQNGWSDPHEISWTNPDGKNIYAINGMHSSVTVGYVGSKNNPSEILINDPWRGVYTISKVEYERRLSYFKVALVID